MNDIQQKKLERYVKGWPFMTPDEKFDAIKYILVIHKEQVEHYENALQLAYKTLSKSEQLVEELQVIRKDQQRQLDKLYSFIEINESIQEEYDLYEGRLACIFFNEGESEMSSVNKQVSPTEPLA
ncbi:hypothetical protein [Terribacillus saccharophilus]|uniref:Uncharacterized protein n=1 Tax=Terribacillus saccharophilus TaxID=361277 RepID=A0ABX4H0S2_9BACI|nr:hypothetical protein [Terribacillus saccharophilus]PAD36348.1 hypothetical protein CHH56_04980 [Terribacillus saccharophilus]PAD95010.1 hypothetical protein CHH50_15505 [Terribacillus saccharophilus]PAE00723.1 hypothetical protein CHH48_05690 [Terribacillus saccharophilus]